MPRITIFTPLNDFLSNYNLTLLGEFNKERMKSWMKSFDQGVGQDDIGKTVISLGQHPKNAEYVSSADKDTLNEIIDRSSQLTVIGGHKGHADIFNKSSKNITRLPADTPIGEVVSSVSGQEPSNSQRQFKGRTSAEAAIKSASNSEPIEIKPNNTVAPESIVIPNPPASSAV